MVLIDTSVWIRFFAGRSPYKADFLDLLARDEVIGHELVYGELLMGDRGGRPALLALYNRIQIARTIPHHQVVNLAARRNLSGRGIGWIDVHLLASALVEHCRLWTADSSLAMIAGELSIAYQPTLNQ